MPTAKQKAAVANLVGNGGNVTQAMLDAGYSPNTANTPQKLTESEGFKEAVEPFVEKLRKERERLINSMMKKQLEGVEYRDHVKAVDVLTKNVQLLSGGPTERKQVNVERVEQINNALDDL